MIFLNYHTFFGRNHKEPKEALVRLSTVPCPNNFGRNREPSRISSCVHCSLTHVGFLFCFVFAFSTQISCALWKIQRYVFPSIRSFNLVGEKSITHINQVKIKKIHRLKKELSSEKREIRFGQI